MNESNKNVDLNKRDFVKKAAYAAPVIMTMAAAPSFAGTGSGFPQPQRGQPHSPQPSSFGARTDRHNGRSRPSGRS